MDIKPVSLATMYALNALGLEFVIEDGLVTSVEKCD